MVSGSSDLRAVRAGLAACALAACLASPALAELTAEEVLADQLNLLSGYGLLEVEATGTTTRLDGLTVAGFVARFTDDDGAAVELRLGGIELREQGDGTVRVIYPARLPLTVSTEAAGADITEMSATVAFDGMWHEVSGEPGDIRHAISFERLALLDLATEPADALPDALDYEFSLSDGKSMLRFVDGDLPRRDMLFDIGAFVLRLALAEGGALEDVTELDALLELTGLQARVGYVGAAVPEHSLDMAFDRLVWRQAMTGEGMDDLDIALESEGFELAYDVALSFEAMEADPVAALAAGQRAEGRMRYGGFRYAVDGVTPEGPLRMASSGRDMRGDFRLDRRGLSVASGVGPVEAEIAIPPNPEFPLPGLSYRIAESALDLEVPFAPGEARQPVRLRFALDGLEFGEDLWGLFDPDRHLPRDPMAVELDLDGSTVVASDPLEAGAGDLPFRETEGRLNALRLSIGGAELTASGAGRDTTRPGAPPSGAGRIDMRLTGANRLLDALAELGMVTQDDLMPLRMGLALIARPGEGPDTLVSTIEVNEAGAVTANGQRIK